MVEMINNEYGSGDYVVKYDMDGNGHVDNVYFSDEAVAASFEECYVNKDPGSCAPSLIDGISSVQFFTKNGLKGKECVTSDYFVPPLMRLKGSLSGLMEKFDSLGSGALREMAADLLDVVVYRPENGRVQELAKRYLTRLNNLVDSNGRMSEKELDLVARLAANHRSDLGNLIKGAANVFDGNIKESLFMAFTEMLDGCYGASCADDAVELTEKELEAVTALFSSKVTDCLLGKEIDNERTIGGIPCAAGSYVEYNDNGDPTMATLSRDFEFGKFTFKKGSQLMFDEYGNLERAKLSRDQYLDGYHVSAEMPVTFKGKNELSVFKAAGDQTVNNVPIKKGMLVELSPKYYDQPIAINFEGVLYVQGIPASSGSVHLGAKGNYSHGRFENIYRGIFINMSPRYFNSLRGPVFYPEGQLKAADLGKDHEIEGIHFSKGTEVEFNENGDLKNAILVDDTYVRGVKLQKQDVVTFVENGGPVIAYLSSERFINGEKYNVGDEVELLGNGELKRTRYSI